MNLMHYMDQGGIIMYILLGLNILGFTTMIIKFIQILSAKVKRKKILEMLLQSRNSISDKNANHHIIKDRITEKMIQLEGGLSTIKIIASIAPLLGLLGTTIGVLLSFEAISAQGLDDPAIFAKGISMALITTVGGLIVAIPHYIGYNYLIGLLDSLEATLHKEATTTIYRDRT